MKSNVGNADKIIRIILAIVLVALFFAGTLTGVLGAVALVVAGVLLLTTLFGFCPIYRVFGMSSCPRR